MVYVVKIGSGGETLGEGVIFSIILVIISKVIVED